MVATRARLARGGLVVVAALALAGACAQGAVVEENNDDDGSGGSGATGGNAGGIGGDGGTGPCGVDCAATVDAPQCHIAVCNEASGVCEIVPGEDASPCEDGLFCTSGDICNDGVCINGPPNDCGMEPAQCNLVGCNEDTDSCVMTPAANGTSCTSANLCLLGATCQNGLCAGGTIDDCFLAPVPNVCHSAVCNPDTGECEAMPDPGLDNTPCSDPAQLCTVNMACNNGTCDGGVPKDCSGLSVGCNTGSCNMATGACIATPIPDGSGCNDGNSCTSGELCSLGSCSGGTPITACTNADQCCPAGCTELNDDDCGNDVIVVHASPYIADVQTKLQSTGLFPVLTMFDASFATPTLAQLQAHDVAFVFSDGSFTDPVTLGDNLADFYDTGGRVVTAVFGMCSTIEIMGRWGDPAQGYTLLSVAFQDQPADSMGTVLEPASPLMTGVTSLTATSAYRCTGTPINGGVVVAQWASLGSALVVRGVVHGRNRADLNFYPPSIDARSDFWSGDGLALMRNALLYK
jgi:hypothetical protein